MNNIWKFAFNPKSYRIHPLGFFFSKFPLESGRELRSHIWPDPINLKIDTQSQNAHDHIFDIESTVILGAMEHRLFQFSEDFKGSVSEFHVSYNADRSIITKSGRVGILKETARFTIFASNTYNLSAGVTHIVTPVNFPCMTLLKTTEKLNLSRVYGITNENNSFTRRFVKSHEVDYIQSIVGSLPHNLNVLKHDNYPS